jgi:ATP-dependent RNA helicase RhlB
MNDPTKVEVMPEQVTAENIEHVLYHVGRHEKLPLLLGVMEREKPARVLIFVNTKREADWLTMRLGDHNYRAGSLTGDVNQRLRLRLVRDFKSGDLPIMVATDVASRGLHVEGVTHVINYDLPQDAENYVHRIGRTARAGASGIALSLACESYVMSLEEIEKYIGFRIPVVHVEDHMLVKPVPPSHRHPSSRPRRDHPRSNEGGGGAARPPRRGGRRPSGGRSAPTSNK